MGKFNFKPEDVARGTILPTGWTALEISKVEDTVSKGSGKPVTFVDFAVIDHPGVNIRHYFSPSAPSFALPFVQAMGGGVGPEGKEVDIDQSLVGQKVNGMITNEPYEGRMQNKISDFRPIGS